MSTYLGAAALDRLDEEHDALCGAAGVPITGRATWLRAILTGEPDCTPVYVAVEEGGERRAGATFALRRGRLVSRVEAPGPGVTDSHWFPARDRVASLALAAEIAGFLTSLRRWQLQVDSAPPGDACLLELCRLLPRTRLSPGDGMPRLRLTDDRAEASYVSRNARNQARRAAQKLADRADCRWEDTCDPDRIAELLPEVMRVHAARDVQLGRASDLDDPRYRRVFSSVICDHARREEVELQLLWVDGELASYELLLVDRPLRAMRLWDGRVSPPFLEHSVGRISAMAMVKRALGDAHVDELDWMRGEEPYKLSYANDVVPTVDLWAWSSTASRIPRAAYEAAREVKRSNKALGTLWRRLKTGRGPATLPPAE